MCASFQKVPGGVWSSYLVWYMLKQFPIAKIVHFCLFLLQFKKKLSDFDKLEKLNLSTSWERCCQGKNYSVLSQPGRGPGSENYAQILQLYKELASRRKVRFRQTFFQIELRKVLYEEVMVIDPHDPSGRIPSPSKLGKMQKCKKKFQNRSPML